MKAFIFVWGDLKSFPDVCSGYCHGNTSSAEAELLKNTFSEQVLAVFARVPLTMKIISEKSIFFLLKRLLRILSLK